MRWRIGACAWAKISQGSSINMDGWPDRKCESSGRLGRLDGSDRCPRRAIGDLLPAVCVYVSVCTNVCTYACCLSVYVCVCVCCLWRVVRAPKLSKRLAWRICCCQPTDQVMIYSHMCLFLHASVWRPVVFSTNKCSTLISCSCTWGICHLGVLQYSPLFLQAKPLCSRQESACFTICLCD